MLLTKIVFIWDDILKNCLNVKAKEKLHFKKYLNTLNQHNGIQVKLCHELLCEKNILIICDALSFMKYTVYRSKVNKTL